MTTISIKRSARRKTLSLAVYPDRRVVLSVPMRFPESKIELFLSEKRDWIEKKLALFSKITIQRPRLDPALKKTYPFLALEKFKARIAHYAPLLQVAPKSVAVRNYKSRWGTCKSTGDLIFNWRLILASDEIFDYVVVHELSHLKQFNHSPAFWNTVGSVFPHYKKVRKELKLASLRQELDF
jgi:predicted metal-dependent hydrolase